MVVVVVVVARHGSGMRQQIRTWPGAAAAGRQDSVGATRLYERTDQSSREPRNELPRARASLLVFFFSFRSLECSFVSLFLSLSFSRFLAARFYERRNVSSSPRRSCLPPSSSILPAVDRPSVSVPIREHSRIPPAAISVSVTYTNYRHSCSSSRSRRTYDAAAGRPRNAEGSRVWSKASAATRALDPPPPSSSSSREYHLPDAADAR